MDGQDLQHTGSLTGYLQLKGFPVLVRLDLAQPRAIEIPPALDGSTGKLRLPDADANMLQVNTDLDAVEAWLDSFSAEATRKAYAHEADRLLLWCYSLAGKPLSSLYQIDYLAYREFLLDPPADWCGPRRGRTHREWRPFAGPVSEKTADQAMTIIKALLSFLMGAGYLMSNPLAVRVGWKDKKAKTDDDKRESIANALKQEAPKQRVFKAIDIDLIRATADEPGPGYDPQRPYDAQIRDDIERKRFLVALLLGTGLRISEVALHTMGSFRAEENGSGERVVRFRFIGKGAKVRWVPVSERLEKALRRYRVHLGLTPFPNPKEDTPLMASLRTGKPVTARTLHNLIIEVLERAAAHALDQDQAARLQKATPHWFRHTYVTEVGRYTDVRLQQALAGHSDIRTTMIYTHSDEDEMHAVVERSRF